MAVVKRRAKIGVIGTINRDIITFPDGSTRKGWGGIIYNLKTFSLILRNKAEIFPACNVGADCFMSIKRILKGLNGINRVSVYKVGEKNNSCHLFYQNNEEKKEILRGGVRRLVFDNIRPLLSCDIILLNYISGADIYLNSLKKLKRLFKGPIYIDFHSLSLGRHRDGSRFLRRPKCWWKILKIGDYIQMNRQELSLLANGRRLKDFDSIAEDIVRLSRALIRKKIRLMKKTFIITNGPKGASVISFRNNHPEQINIPVQRIVDKGDTTGCGDCFSAGFIAGLVTGKTLKSCGRIGNFAAFECIRRNSNQAHRTQ